MYATCLFCHASLGANEVIEAFPVGRRLAFDAAKGRLWVVCRQCERWNLTPLEERWEAIEQCERAFRDTKLRMSTDEIGLARLREGLELVRIGAPQRPEMAAWRYGDQFGRRWRRAMLLSGAAAAAVGGFVIAGPGVAILGGGALTAMSLFDSGRNAYRTRKIAAHVAAPEGGTLLVSQAQMDHAALVWEAVDRRWSLEIVHRPDGSGKRRRWDGFDGWDMTPVRGDDAARAARLLLPSINASGARRTIVRDAIGVLEETAVPHFLFERTARTHGHYGRITLRSLPAAVRLALEMAVHEDSERRALEGELHLLEAAWRDAEEIAGIADDMFLPASVDEGMKRLKRPSS